MSNTIESLSKTGMVVMCTVSGTFVSRANAAEACRQIHVLPPSQVRFLRKIFRLSDKEWGDAVVALAKIATAAEEPSEVVQ